MEADNQRVGDCHEAAFAVRLHLILLVADVNHDFLGLRRMDIKIGSTLFINLRELVARNSRLSSHGILRHFNLLGNRHLRTLRLVAKETAGRLAVATTQLTIARSIEVQAVGTIGASLGRDNLTSVNGLRQLVYLLVASDADALAIGLHNASHIERHLFWLQFQVAEQMVIDVLHLLPPLRVSRVRLALMHQDAFDDAILLSLLRQSNERLVGIIVVVGEYARHPCGNLLQVALDAIGHETFYLDAANSHMNNANLNVLRQRSHKSTAKPISRRQARIGTAKRSRSLAPLAFLTSSFCVVHSRHQQEARAWAGDIHSFRSSCAFHIRLSKAKEDVEVRVRSLSLQAQSTQEKNRKDSISFHNIMRV